MANMQQRQMIVRGPDLYRLLRVVETAGWHIDIDPDSTLQDIFSTIEPSD